MAFGLLGCSFIGVRNPPEQLPIHAPIDCKDSSALPSIDTVGAVIGLGFGGLLTIGGLSCQPGGGSGCDGAVIGLIVGVPVLALGALYTASAVHGYGATSRCRDAKQHRQQGKQPAESLSGSDPNEATRAESPSDFDRTQSRERAEMRMKAAFDAARTGDCATVAKVDVELREIDVEFHDKVFVRDVGIARCLAGNVPAPPIMPAPGPVPQSP